MSEDVTSSRPPARAPLERAQIEPLLGAARELGIDADAEDVAARGALWGSYRSVRVALGVRFVGGQPVGFAHFAEAPDPVLGPLTVEPWTGQARGRQLSGDAEADGAIAVHGDPPMVRAWLDAPTRARLVELFAHIPRPLSLRMERRRATFRGAETLDVTAARVRADVEALVALVDGARLSSRPELERVVHNALEDPEPEVRERNAAVLGELMSAAGEDARYGAAVRLLSTDQIAIDHRVDLLRIVRTLPAERIAPLMHRLLDEGELALARRAVSWAGEVEDEESVRHLVKLLRRFDDSSLRLAVVEVLGQIGDSRAQTALLNLLDREEEGLRMHVIRALGRVGGAEAAEQIRPFTKGLFTDRELKKAAREAMTEIEARITGTFPIPEPED